MAIVFTIALLRNSSTEVPKLANKNLIYKKILNPDDPIIFKNDQNISYKNMKNVLLDSKPKSVKAQGHKKTSVKKKPAIRAGFYVNWDAQSFTSLRNHIDQMNMILPEWFFVTDTSDIVQSKIDQKALKLIQQHKVPIVAMLSNFTNEQWNGKNVHRIIATPQSRARFINSVIGVLSKNKLQGINVDFEELTETTDEKLIQFQRELYNALHSHGYIVSQDIAPNNEDYNLQVASIYNDYLFIMAYDQHFATSRPGPIAEQKWVENIIDQFGQVVPQEKMVLCLAAYGYDWPKDGEAADVTYQEALTTAAESEGKIKFDNNNYNLSYTYFDDADVPHSVFFTDAATNYNTMKVADQSGLAGVSLWRLGSEDPRIWSFYKKDISSDSTKSGLNMTAMQHVHAVSDIDYIGEGEVLDILSYPTEGQINLTYNIKDQLITEQQYITLPTSYVVKKFGKGEKEIILSFDDGPDERYTPQILDILKKEHIPATFFVIGQNAENNIPLLKTIYKDGYEIGNHSFTHPNMAEISPERQRLEMNSTRRLIECITGHSTVLFRPPFNADAEPQTYAEIEPVAMSKKDNYLTIGESIDPRDWEAGVTADTIFKRVVEQQNLGSIILLHDSGGNRNATIEALPKIIHYFKNKGYKFITVSQLVGKKRDDLMPVISNSKDLLLSKVNYVVAMVMFYFEHTVEAVFILGIIFSVVRMLLIGILAYIQKRKRKSEVLSSATPKVSIIVPAYNEEVNAVNTINNLLKSTYPDFEVIFVDDGSKDNTYNKVWEAFANNNVVKVLTKHNGGKASALNYGITQARSEYVICIDADTQLQYNAIGELMKKFVNETIIAVAGNVKVGNQINILTAWQSIEYITAQNFDRRAFDLLNGITVIPGAIGAFRKDSINKAGMFTTDTMAEDCDLTIRLLKNGGKVVYTPDAIAVTEAPESIKMFIQQRFRWTYGIMQSFWKHRNLCFNPRYRSLGMIALPNVLIFQLLLPIASPLADLLMLYALLSGGVSFVLGYYLMFIFVDAIGAAIAFSFEKENIAKLWLLIPQRFFYRQLMYYILFKAILQAIRGEMINWGVLKRTGNVELKQV
ncbi:polysaccharide deacetylase family protein [Solitalea koreensis]|nr:glycosyltransferase [Solitalea koreensis]